MPTPNNATKNLYRSIYLLYVALFLGQILMGFVIIFLITRPDHALKDGSDYPTLGLLIILLAGGAAWWINSMRREQIFKLRFANLLEKMQHYRTSILIRSAITEAANLFCLVIALLESSLTPLLFFCLGLGVFLFFRPKSQEFIANYGLDGEEQQQIQGYLKNRS